jgi:hypothetical protein
VPTAVKLAVGAGLVFAALLVVGRLTDLPTGPFTDTFGRTSAEQTTETGTPADPTAVSAQEWTAIARDPAAHRGEHIRLTGRLTRLWVAADGTEGAADTDGTARATVGGHLPSGARTAVTPAVLRGDRETFRGLDLHDEVDLRVVVEGAGGDGVPEHMPVLRVERASVLRGN